MIKKIFITIFLTLTLASSNTFALESLWGYSITNYDIDLIVNIDDTFNITENIEVNFEESRHWIFRKIPLKYEVYRKDWTTSKVLSKVSNIKVNNFFKTYNENWSKIIKIWSPIFTIKW
jgi:hypothetical protein